MDTKSGVDYSGSVYIDIGGSCIILHSDRSMVKLLKLIKGTRDGLRDKMLKKAINEKIKIHKIHKIDLDKHLVIVLKDMDSYGLELFKKQWDKKMKEWGAKGKYIFISGDLEIYEVVDG